MSVSKHPFNSNNHIKVSGSQHPAQAGALSLKLMGRLMARITAMVA